MAVPSRSGTHTHVYRERSNTSLRVWVTLVCTPNLRRLVPMTRYTECFDLERPFVKKPKTWFSIPTAMESLTESVSLMTSVFTTSTMSLFCQSLGLVNLLEPHAYVSRDLAMLHLPQLDWSTKLCPISPLGHSSSTWSSFLLPSWVSCMFPLCNPTNSSWWVPLTPEAFMCRNYPYRGVRVVTHFPNSSYIRFSQLCNYACPRRITYLKDREMKGQLTGKNN